MQCRIPEPMAKKAKTQPESQGRSAMQVASEAEKGNIKRKSM